MKRVLLLAAMFCGLSGAAWADGMVGASGFFAPRVHMDLCHGHSCGDGDVRKMSGGGGLFAEYAASRNFGFGLSGEFQYWPISGAGMKVFSVVPYARLSLPLANSGFDLFATLGVGYARFDRHLDPDYKDDDIAGNGVTVHTQLGLQYMIPETHLAPFVAFGTSWSRFNVRLPVADDGESDVQSRVYNASPQLLMMVMGLAYRI